MNIQETVIIHNELGLHARPAAMISRMVEKAEKSIWIVDGTHKADASSVIDILTLNAAKGTELLLEIESEMDRSILNELIAFFKSGFGEDDNEKR